MDGDPAAPGRAEDDAAERASPGRGSAPPPRSPEAQEPKGRGAPEAREPSDPRAPGPPAASDRSDAARSKTAERWRSLVDAVLALWARTASHRQKLGRLLRRVIEALGESAPVSGVTSPVPAGPLTERLDTLAPIRVSGQGRAFNFHIHARCVWSSENLRRESLVSYAHFYMPEATRRLTQLAARHAGSFAASRAPELEVALQRALSETGPWRYERGDKVVTCQPHVWVDVDERVRKVVLPYWEKLVKLDCEFDIDQRQAEYDTRLGRQRTTGADNPAGGTAAGGAAQPTSEHLTSEMRRLVVELTAVVQRLEDLLRRTMPDGDNT